MKKLFIVCLSLVFLIALSGCLYSVRYDSEYAGKVIDADTKEPIEGVVVLGTWSVVHHGPAGGVHEFYDAKETITDKKGEFRISGQGLRVLSNLEPMQVVIFKAGYEYIQGEWDKEADFWERIKWEGNKAMISLKELTMEERKKSITFPPYPDTEVQRENKAKRFMEEIYKERKERGLN